MISEYDKRHIHAILTGHGDWFTAQLLRLCAKADSKNLNRIRQGFPEVVDAYELWLYGHPRMDYDEARHDAGLI